MGTENPVLQRIVQIIKRQGDGGILILPDSDPLELLFFLRINGALGDKDARRFRANPKEANHVQLKRIQEALDYGEATYQIGLVYDNDGFYSIDDNGNHDYDRSILLYETSWIHSQTQAKYMFEYSDASLYKHLPSRQHRDFVSSLD
jgi:hypothetical protein